jgi:hypothetical protein
VVDERFGPVDRAAALAIEGATLDVDDEEGGGVHWIVCPRQVRFDERV